MERNNTMEQSLIFRNNPDVVSTRESWDWTHDLHAEVEALSQSYEGGQESHGLQTCTPSAGMFSVSRDTGLLG